MRAAILCTTLLAGALLAAGCQTTGPNLPPLTPEEVVQLSQAGSSAETIFSAARQRGVGFPLTVENILWLREQGVADEAVNGLLDAEREREIWAQARRPPISIGLGFGWYGGRSHWGHRRHWW